MRIVIKGGVWKNTEVRETRKKEDRRRRRCKGKRRKGRKHTRVSGREREREHATVGNEMKDDEVLTSGQRDDERMRSSKQP